MATEQKAESGEGERLTSNLARMEALTQRLTAAMAGKRQIRPALQGPGPELYQKVAAAWMAQMFADPGKLIETQAKLWKGTLLHFAEAQKALAEGRTPQDAAPEDPRFSSPLWQTHPWFSYVKQQYLLNAKALKESIASLDGLDDRDRKRLQYFGQQIIDLMAPTNFLATNPEALQKAIETDGQSLVDGLENLVRDLETNRGDLLVTLADPDAFTVGKNLATTPGKVVFRNRMMELIQYSPTTDEVYERPLVIFPPWINKYYILDLRPQNSMIRWIVEQGFTVFVVSWVNPDGKYADVGLDQYVQEGYFEALRIASEICKVEQVNAVGYCIGGTMLAMALAWLAEEGREPIANATFFTTLTDFSEQGEMSVFLDNDFVDGIEDECAEKGYLESFYMARTFSYLRANDLVYQPAIRSYMLGEKPPAFDLLYWNGDGTNLPGRMAIEYLRDLCQKDMFAQGGFPLLGRTVQIAQVRTPLISIACESDHIAAWRSCYAGVAAMGAQDKTFLLAGSGHIAGIVNPPSRNKYQHWWGGSIGPNPEAWKEGSQNAPGSWWPHWGEWLAGRSGKKVKARTPGRGKYKALGDAPGTYVLVKVNGLKAAQA